MIFVKFNVMDFSDDIVQLVERNSFYTESWMALSKKIRFEVFKRDDFTCMYCGRKTPDVVLEIDHIIPRAEGGDDDIQNLVTSCFECNRGKGATPLDKVKTRDDLEEDLYLLAERELQIREYRKILQSKRNREDSDISKLSQYWSERSEGKYSLTEQGQQSLKSFLKDFMPEQIKEAIDIAYSKITIPEQRFKYMCGILHNWRRDKIERGSSSDILFYWRKKRPQNWKQADEGTVEYLLQTYDPVRIKFYIDRTVAELRGWASFDDVVKSLKENKYD